jgi:hypothetical protein
MAKIVTVHLDDESIEKLAHAIILKWSQAMNNQLSIKPGFGFVCHGDINEKVLSEWADKVNDSLVRG